jgi:hypothetical protein
MSTSELEQEVDKHLCRGHPRLSATTPPERCGMMGRLPQDEETSLSLSSGAVEGDEGEGACGGSIFFPRIWLRR